MNLYAPHKTSSMESSSGSESTQTSIFYPDPGGVDGETKKGEQQRWPMRDPATQRQLFATPEKWLQFLPYLDKDALMKCREVSESTNQLIERYWRPQPIRRGAGGAIIERVLLPQRRILDRFDIKVLAIDEDFVNALGWLNGIGGNDLQHQQKIPRLWFDESPEEKVAIEEKVVKLTGERICPHESDVSEVEISVLANKHLYARLKNKLDESGARYLARLLPQLNRVSFRDVAFVFDSTPPDDDGDDGDGASSLPALFNPLVFSLLDGKPLKLVTRRLDISRRRPHHNASSLLSVVKTLKPLVWCTVLDRQCDGVWGNPDLLDYLRLVTMAIGFNAPANLESSSITRADLDQLLEYFCAQVTDFYHAVPSFRLYLSSRPAWPVSIPISRAINPRIQQVMEQIYVFELHNENSGERFRVVAHGAKKCNGTSDDESSLKVTMVVLQFRDDRHKT